MNIFDMDYTRQEVAFMGLPMDTDLTVGDARIVVNELPFGRLDAYLNVDFVIEPLVIPTYLLNGDIFMSVTPMETQSMWVAIERAKQAETVALGGLGLGYCVLRMCDPDGGGVTTRIDVYEQSQDCIDAFNQLHRGKPGFGILNIIHGDIYKECVGRTYDFMFNDIYQCTGQDEILTDIQFFLQKNKIKEYRYWGQELMAMVATGSYDFDSEEHPAMMRDQGILTYEDSTLFAMHEESEGSSMKTGFSDEDFAFNCVDMHITCQLRYDDTREEKAA
jgi:hypothetical protein